MTVRRLNPSVFAALVVLATATVIQEGVVGRFSVAGIAPNIVLLIVVNWGLVRGVEEGMLWGLIGGIFLDLFSGLPFGTSAAAFVAIAGLLSLGETSLLRTNVMLPLVAAFLATILYYAIAIVIVASINHEVLLAGFTVRVVLGVAVYNAIINPLLYVACQSFDRRLHPVARANW